MARLIAISGPALADGFRLAGLATTVVGPGADVLAAVRAVVATQDVGLVVVTDDVWAGLDDRSQDTLERLPQPIVLAIPGGAPTDVVTRRELVAEMLRRAIGYRIQLDEGRP